MRPRRALAAIDLADILDQPGVALVDAGDRDGTTRLLGPARDFLQQPGAECIDLAHTGEIDAQAFRRRKLRRGRIEQAFQQTRVDHRPRSRGTEFKRVADRGNAEKGR